YTRVSFFFSSRRRHTRSKRDWSSDVCSSDLLRRDRKHPKKRPDQNQSSARRSSCCQCSLPRGLVRRASTSPTGVLDDPPHVGANPEQGYPVLHPDSAAAGYMKSGAATASCRFGLGRIEMSRPECATGRYVS